MLTTVQLEFYFHLMTVVTCPYRCDRNISMKPYYKLVSFYVIRHDMMLGAVYNLISKRLEMSSGKTVRL